MTSGAATAAQDPRARRGHRHLLCGVSISVLALASLPAAAQDATRYWDANGALPGSGGSGTWNTANQLWTESNSDVLGPYKVWSNAGLDNAVFGITAAGTTTTAGTITVTQPVTVHHMRFQSVNGWTLDGGTITLGGVAPMIITNATTTINSTLAGTAGLIKSGGGALSLTGANTFSGGVILEGGTLTVSNDAALGAASNAINVTANSSLTIGGAPTSRTINIASGTTVVVTGAGAGGALYTGGGSLNSRTGVRYTNDFSTYTGSTIFRGENGCVCQTFFSSVRNLGEASSLGAPTDATAGTIIFNQQSQYADNIVYTGDGDTTNRNWDFNGNGAWLNNEGTGALILTGNMDISVGGGIRAIGGDVDLSGVLSGGLFNFSAGAGRKVTVSGVANTFTGAAGIGGLVEVASLANAGANSSLGAGSSIALNVGTLSYTGVAAASDRTWTVSGANLLRNDGSGALALSGGLSFAVGGAADTLTFGGSFSGENTFSGAITGAGNLVSDGAGTWVLGGANTYAGTTTVTSGTLRAGHASAFGATTNVRVNGGVLDLNGFSLSTSELHGTGGSVALGTNPLTTLTIDGAAASDYAGAITGAGGLTKLGTSTLTLTGANTYTGATSIGGGTLTLNFAGVGAPVNNIIAGGSALNMSGGKLQVTGAAGVTNDQTFASTTVSAGANTISAASGAGGAANLHLGAISRTSGLVNFVLPTSGSITTASASLGGWATVNGTDYAKVVGGKILPFAEADYTDKDDVATWLADEFISDSDGDGVGFSGTLAGSMQLGGLQFTEAAVSTVTVAAGQTLGVDGAIIVAPSVGTNSQTIGGGNLRGAAGGVLGVQHNGGGLFTIGSTIVDNGGVTGLTKGGAGRLLLTGANTYTGATTLSAGRLEITNLANGGAASSIGQSSAASANLVLQGGTLAWTGAADAVTNRGFTLVNGGAGDPMIEVGAGRTIEFSGLATSSDDAGLTKTGAGTLVLSNAANDYVGVTRITGIGGGGALQVNTLANGGQVSGIGKSSAASANLVLESGGQLIYTGGTASTNRGFTMENGGRIGVSQAATILTIGGAAVGNGNLHKDGDGTLVLAGANTYSGPTLVNAGVLRAGSTQAFGGPNLMTLANAAGVRLELAGFNNKVGGLSGGGAAGGNVSLGAATLTIGGTNATFNGTIDGVGGLRKDNTSTQTLANCASTFTGATTLLAGTLSVACLANGGLASSIGASGAASANLAFNGGTLLYTGGTVTIDRGILLQGNGAVSIDNAGTALEISGTITGAGNFAKTGAGTLVLSGANDYSGGTNVYGGTLRVLSPTALGTGGLRMGLAGTRLDLSAVAGSAVSVGWIDDSGVGVNAASAGDIDLGATTLTITPGAGAAGLGGAANYAGVISGTGGIVKAGGSVQQFSGCNNAYTGATTISGGVLAVDCLVDGTAASSIGASTADAASLILNGGTLRYVGTGHTTNRLFTLGASATSAIDASGTGAIVFSNTAPIAFSTPNTAQSVTLTGASTADNKLGLQITDNGTGKTGLSKTGLGVWILTNPGSTYTGVTSITGGVLGVDKLTDGGVASSLGQSSNLAANLVIGSGATLRYTGAGDTTDRRFTLGVGTTAIESTGSGAVVFNNTAGVSYSGNGLRVVSLGGSNADDNIMGAAIGNQTVANVSALAKNGAGKWILTGNNTYTGVTNINAGTLVLGAGGTTGSIASQTVNNFGVLGFDRADALTYGGVISQAGSVEQLGAGKTTLTGTNIYTGGTTIRAGTLELGSGGATGSILGDVTNDGLFIFNRSNTYAFTGRVSGAGGLRQAGSGETVLSAANSYLGATDVLAGTLRINGDQSAATGLTTVHGGATLGGLGTIGGDVVVQNGGAISPGASPGTLTINGDLILNASSALNMEFGQANVVGGALNDLIVVNGDLTLDGVINVTVPTGGAFTAGVYRVIDYTGGFTDNTLSVGSMPGGASAIVQTSVLGQVNLVNNAGQTLYFWDGPTGGKNDGIVTGGAGTWRLGGGANDWANSAGSVNSDFAPDAFAVFQGTAGTVTVDAAGGAVGVSGLQFAVDGYVVSGGGLTLAAGQTPIRVGDLTPAAAGMTATINSVLSGAGQLVKVDAGTLVLTGTNTYTGGTLVNQGVLQVSQESSLGAGGLTLDGGTLRTSVGLARAVTLGAAGGTITPSVTSTFSGPITGVGRLTKGGTGILRLTGTHTYSGGTTISGGALALGDGAIAGSITGDVLNNAQLIFNNPGAQTFDGLISGSGQVRKSGGGTETLTGANTYAGATTVSVGTLLINGDQSMATGLTTVSAGTLGGSGTIGGDVTAAAGAALAPGGAVGAPGTLTIKGDLSLAGATTSLNYEFGQANLPGGTFNDLIKIGGDASLGGATINVASSAPSFGPGLYRVIDYTGTRTGSLTLGSQPAGASFLVQTSVDKQVNLVNTAGLTLNIWDGGAGGRNDGDIAGGAGTWQGGSGNDNWTLADGSVNAPFANSSFAVFTKTGGVVTVDGSSGGPINVSGMQFAATGYELTGDQINLTAPESNIWVGDGTSNSETIAAVIDANLGGAGGLVKTDAGTLRLLGANAYAGETKVNGGTLEIGGDQSGATGATFVNSGGVLKGAGIIGGDVTVGAGGTLAPGAAIGRLTINGDLILTADATLAMELGQAGTPGGALNDLIVVGGDLTLDGALNVTQSVGGAFGPGVYRLIDYTGALTDNTLNIGSLPSDYGTIQTSIARQVNLVVTATPPGGVGPGPGGPGGPGSVDPGGPTTPTSPFNFWDGDQGVAGDKVVSGGDGTWRASPANWTTSTGQANGAFTPASFAIFAAQAGTVTVDAAEGAIRVSGMQFAADGYALVGDAISLESGEAVVRVGDGTTLGGAFSATIDSKLTGAGRLLKTDAGTLILTGASDYAGGTRISGGTLQLGDGGKGGSIRGDVQNDGRLAFNRSDDLAFAGSISGGGVIAQIGSGVTTLSGDSSAFGGRSEVRYGTLAVDGKLGGAVEVFDGARLTGHGQVGSLLNQAGGIVAPGGFGVLTVAGDYEGRGGTLKIDAVLGGDDSPTDRLLVRGAASGTTLVEVANRGGLGAQTSNGILVVNVEGASDGVFTLAKGDFRLGGENALVAGAYAYVLRQDAQGGDWKLRSSVNEVGGPPRPADPDHPVGEPGAPVEGEPQITLYQPGAPVYEAYAHTLQTLNGLATMRQRVGARQWSDEAGSGVWGRMEGGRVKLVPAVSTTNVELETDRWKVQFGIDQALADDVAGGRLTGGLTVHYGEASTSVGSPFGGGSLDAKALGLGATLTWTNVLGAYVDAQAQASWFETDLRSSILGDRAENAEGLGYAISLEAGKTMSAAGAFSFTPQVQLTYARVDFDSFVDPLGARVAADEGDSLTARLGLALDRDWTVASSGGEGRIYGLVNLTHEFLDGSQVGVSGTPLVNRAERTWGGLAVGASYGWGAGRYAVYGEAAVDAPLSGFGDSYAVSGTTGFRMLF
ncbi:autotransporter-associated beta strand repeat-containing protein [Phenylobacterium sp.]|uniref:autotransporter-associated beta strand repeat-containing protein n=1 Tax=Phenylobacterium sp. TaxID=1871053 RepID=UPI0025D190C6|nr:autotransporter-associated beta strand repeat-containing protein [Phenylobacterium sp.]